MISYNLQHHRVRRICGSLPASIPPVALGPDTCGSPRWYVPKSRLPCKLWSRNTGRDSAVGLPICSSSQGELVSTCSDFLLETLLLGSVCLFRKNVCHYTTGFRCRMCTSGLSGSRSCLCGSDNPTGRRLFLRWHRVHLCAPPCIFPRLLCRRAGLDSSYRQVESSCKGRSHRRRIPETRTHLVALVSSSVHEVLSS